MAASSGAWVVSWHARPRVELHLRAIVCAAGLTSGLAIQLPAPGLSVGAACLYRFFTTQTNYRRSVPAVSIIGSSADTRDVE
jgi:hypothetical protein